MATAIEKVQLVIEAAAKNVRGVIGQVRELESAVERARARLGGGLPVSAFERGVSVFGSLGAAVTGATAAFGAMRGALDAVIGGFASVYAEGLRFSRTLETTELSIRALVANQLLAAGSVKDVGEAFRIAGAVGKDQLEKLKLAAIDTSVSFEALSAAFQEALGTGLAKGFNPDQIRQLTLQLGQMAAILGMPGYQLPQEIRAILTGQIDRNARVGMSIFNTEEDRKKLQQLLNTDVNAAFAFIQSKLQAVTAGGQMASRTFEGLLGNARESLTLFATIGSGALFSGFKQALSQVQSSVVEIVRNAQTGAAESIRLTPPFERLAGLLNAIGAAFSRVLLNAVTYIQSAAERLGRVLERNPDLVRQLAREFEAVFEAVLDIGRALVEGLRLDQPRDAAQGLIYILEGIRAVLEVVAGLVSAAAVMFRGWVAVLDAVRVAFVAVTQNAAALLDTLAAAVNAASRLVSFSSTLQGIFAGAANAAAGLAGALRSAANAAAATRAQMGGLREASAEAKLDGKTVSAGLFGAMRPRAGTGGGGGRGGRGAADDPVLEAIERRRAEARRVEQLAAAESERAYRLEKARIDDAIDALKDSYERRLVSAEEYYRRLSSLQEEALANEERRLQRQQAAEFGRMQQSILDRAEAQRIRDAKRREQEVRRIADEEAQAQARLIETTTRLQEVESQRAAVRRRIARETEESYRAEQRAIEELQAAVAAMSSDRFAQERLRAEREYLDAVRAIRPELVQAAASVEDAAEAERNRAAIIAELTDAQREQLRLVEELRQKRLEQIAIDEAVAQANKSINETKREQAMLAEQMRLAGYTDAEIQQAVNAVYERRRAIIEGLIERARAASEALPTQENVEAIRGLGDATRELVTTSADAGAQIRQNLASSLEGLFTSLITNARNAGQAFKQFALSVVQSIAQIIAKMLVLRLLQGAFGGFLGKIGLGGVLPGIPGRASGGPVTANRPYIVGERGPELFVPQVGGSIIPNGKMAPSAPQAQETASAPQVRIVNNIDPAVFDEHLYGVAGERIVINHIRNNRARISQLLRTA